MLLNSLLPCLQFLFQELSRIACRTFRYLFRSTHGYNITTLVTAFGTKVYHVVGTLHYIQVVLNDNDGVTTAYQGIKSFE